MQRDRLWAGTTRAAASRGFGCRLSRHWSHSPTLACVLALLWLAGCTGEIEHRDAQGRDVPAGWRATMGQTGLPGQAGSGAPGIPGGSAVAAPDAPPPMPVCGDGNLEAGETCDPPGSCPTSCVAPDACITSTLSGSAAECTAQCVEAPVTACQPGDGCCPPGCNSLDDDDCEPQCDNGVVEEGELCDPVASCPVDCDDGNQCTEDSLTGMASDCSAACEHVAIEECQPDHARGIRVGAVTIDQGVRIMLAETGAPIAAEERGAELVARRPAMLRAFWELDADFTQREIRAIVTLTAPDGSEEVVETSTMIAAATPDYSDLGSGFVWRLPAESVVPELTYSIELFEADDARNAEPLPSPPPLFPEEGSLDLGVGDTYLKMRVMLVPLAHDVGAGCAAPDLHADFEGRSEADYISERLYAMNPVDEVQVEVHDPVSYSGSARDANPIFTLLRQLREQDQADVGWYYFALIDPCDGGPNFSGVASLGSPSRSAANRRTGWGVYRDRGRSAGMVVHEIGHQQGRNHVRCSGQEAGPDPAYPNTNGDTDSWGWDVLTEERILDPDRHDYMSYCGQNWVSEYGWNFVYPRLATISGWELESTSVSEVPVLHIMVDPDGSIDAWLGRSYPDDEPAHNGPRVAFYAGDQLLAEASARLEAIPKSNAFELTLSPPRDLSAVTHLAFTASGSSYALDAARIKRIR